MIKWLLRRRHASPEADEQLAKATADYEQVAERDEYTKRLERSMRAHLKDNNFANRIRAEILGTQRGKHA